jgi:hypothetical protein
MTSAPAATSEMDHLDQLGAKAFDGFLVRRDLVRQYSHQYPVPTYVVEIRCERELHQQDVVGPGGHCQDLPSPPAAGAAGSDGLAATGCE